MKGGRWSHHQFKHSLPAQPLVSIITVVLNGEKHLEQAIQSVLHQSYPNIEYIVIDGGSKDNTIQIIRKYEERIDHWQSERDEGIFFAMNKGIQLAKGEIIGLLNADDYYAPDAVREVVLAFERSRAGVVYGNMLVDGGSGRPEKPDISLMDKKPSVFHPACFVAKEVYSAIGSFNTRFKISSDYEFLLRCIRKNISFCYLDNTLTHFRTGGMSAKCASNIEGYRIMKMHQTGHHREVIGRGIRCYARHFVKKILNLNNRR
jgi:glycosyltransferase involved in cell wall biosynthesis